MTLAELRLPRTTGSVGLARLIVSAGARTAGLSGERLQDLRVAVSEAVTRAVDSEPRQAPLMLTFGVSGGAFEVHLLHISTWGDAHEPGRQWWQGSGLGRAVIEGLADEVHYPRDLPSQLVLRFDLAARPAGMR